MQSLAALADPTRRRIVEMLAQGQLSAGAIARRFAMSAPAVSQHLQTLKRAHLVRARVDAQRRIYELDPAGFSEVEGWLAGIRQFWAGRLDALEDKLRAAAEEDARKVNARPSDRKVSAGRRRRPR
jgi:DNA-binding transcriptional ArsR family regulator